MIIAITTVVLAIVGLVAARVMKTGRDVALTTGGGLGSEDVRLIMMVIVSLLVLAGALYVILWGGYPDGTQKWAFGAVGTVVGFWLNENKK
jgi:hypothetical protein